MVSSSVCVLCAVCCVLCAVWCVLCGVCVCAVCCGVSVCAVCAVWAVWAVLCLPLAAHGTRMRTRSKRATSIQEQSNNDKAGAGSKGVLAKRASCKLCMGHTSGECFTSVRSTYQRLIQIMKGRFSQCNWNIKPSAASSPSKTKRP